MYKVILEDRTNGIVHEFEYWAHASRYYNNKWPNCYVMDVEDRIEVFDSHSKNRKLLAIVYKEGSRPGK